MLERITHLYFKLLELVLVLCLGAMALMVLGNVILRYCFNSGITASEELSRFLFVWLTYLGAVVGLREVAHLGVDTLVRKLPVLGRRLCFVVNEGLMLLCCVLFLLGTWRQHDTNMGNLSPVTEIPMEWVYGVAYISAGSMGFILLVRLLRLATGRLSDDELIAVSESEEQEVIDAAAATATEGGRA